MNPIANINKYNARMSRSIEDKTEFFLERLEGVKTFVDYGSADGSVIEYLQKDGRMDDTYFVGYDIDQKMIDLAEKNCTKGVFFNDWRVVKDFISGCEGKTAVFAGSLIHEIYSYLNEDQINDFWKELFGGFDYVVIRDMMRTTAWPQKADSKDVKKLLTVEKNRTLVDDHTAVWGNITNRVNFNDFLLKYHYVDNWKRECNENYFPITLEELKRRVPENYELIFEETYQIPFIKDMIKKDYDIDLKDTTHVKLIFRKV